jgi:Type I restriction modification DNA specificity domain
VSSVSASEELYTPNFASEWSRCSLYGLATWINGLAFNDINFAPSGTPVIKIAEIKNGVTGQTKFTRESYDAKYFLHDGDMLFCWSGQPETSIGTYWWRGGDGWLNQHIFKVLPDEHVVSREFFFQLLQYLRPTFIRIARNKQTTGLGHVTKGDLERLEVALPSMDEQRAIAATLGAVDDKIASNQGAVAKALALARAFVDRSVADKPLVSYASALEVLMGSAFKGDKFSAPGIGRPLLRIRDLKTFESQTWTTEVRTDETVIHPGDIVVGMDAEFRATLWLGSDSVLNQRVCSFRGRPGVGRAFVLAVLEPELAFQEQAKSGTTVIHLNKADIDTFAVPELTVAEHRELSEVTEPLIDLAGARAIETRALIQTRDVLLQELVSGRVTVPRSPEPAGAVI